MQHLTIRMTLACLCVSAAQVIADEESEIDPDIALQPATVIVNPWKSHVPPTKRQGVPGIERTANGRLWVVHGRDVESPRNYQVLKSSDNDGHNWSEAKAMILPQEHVRAMSACIWMDPTGRMWVFWGQSFGQQDGRYGIWTIVTSDPDAEFPQWSKPRRLGDGIMLTAQRLGRLSARRQVWTVPCCSDWVIAVEAFK